MGTALEKSPKASQASQSRPQLPGDGLFGKGFSLFGSGRRDHSLLFPVFNASPLDCCFLDLALGHGRGALWLYVRHKATSVSYPFPDMTCEMTIRPSSVPQSDGVRAGETAQLLKWLPRKHEDPSSIPRRATLKSQV